MVQYLESKLSGVLKWILLEFTDQVWKNRNEVMHSTDSNTCSDETEHTTTHNSLPGFLTLCLEGVSDLT